MKSREKHALTVPVTNLDILRAFWSGARPYPIAMALILVGIFTARIVEVIIPVFYKKFFDVLTAVTGSTATKAPELVHIIVVILLLNFALWAGYRLTTFTATYFQSSVIARLRQQAFDYMIEHSYAFYANSFTGSLVQRVGRFGRAFERLVDRLLYNIIPLGVQVFGVIIVLWFNNRLIAEILFAWLLFFLAFNYGFSRFKLKYDIKRAAADSFTTGVLSDALTNQNTIQLFTGAKGESEYFKEVTDDQAKITRFVWDLQNVIETVQALFIFIIEFFLFYFAIKYWQNGTITVGTFVLIQVYLVGLGGQLWDFTRVIRDVYECFTDAREMVEILKLPHGIKDVPRAKVLKVPAGAVSFEDVSFGFHDSRAVLQGVNVAVKSGEKVALIGPSGAGKSTFVKLLFRLYDVDSGVVKIDGQDIKSITQDSLRRNISLVPQDPILFHRTLLENIRYGRRDATDAEALEAARLAHCDEFALSIPTGYDTYVGERGIKLSGGERQRVAIARAILKNAPILVLDEATSSLDSHSESLIQDALDKLMKGKTVIVIAHRLSTIRKMDRIIVMEKGKVIEEGSHDELLKNDSSLYTKLWNLQAGGFLREDEEMV